MSALLCTGCPNFFGLDALLVNLMTYYLPYRSFFFQGADILIEVDTTLADGGADVSCAGGSNSVTFCNGLDGIEELGDGDVANSN